MASSPPRDGLTVRHAGPRENHAVLAQDVRVTASEEASERSDRVGDVAAAIAVEVEDGEPRGIQLHRVGAGTM